MVGWVLHDWRADRKQSPGRWCVIATNESAAAKFTGGRKGGRNLLSNLYLKLREKLTRHDDEEGQGMVEYALILVLIAVVVIIVLILLGNQVKNVFSNISSGLGT